MIVWRSDEQDLILSCIQFAYERTQQQQHQSKKTSDITEPNVFHDV